MQAVSFLFRRSILHVTALALTAACGQGLKPVKIASTQDLEGPLVPAGQKFAIVDTTAISTTLGTSRILTGRLAAAHDFTGTVALSIERNDLDGIDTGGDIIVTPVPAQVDLSPGDIKTITVTIEVRTRSPSFTNSFFKLIGTEVTVAPQKAIVETIIGLTVQNIFEVLLVGGNPPEVWSASATASFRAHPAGLRIRYVNMDLVRSHGIRGTGAVPTQVGVMARATPAGAGGTYEFTVMPAAGPVSGTFFCDTHETAADQHTLNFNQP
ncbi:MAG: hypothetical protein ABL958_04430 [Bdellovibrionia bacterium]